MDFDEVNKELDAVRNNSSDYVKAMNDKFWDDLLKKYTTEATLLEEPQDAVESLLDKTRPVYHDYGVTPPASPVAPQGPSIFVTPWVYHEIMTVLAEIDAIERKEQAKKTRWVRLRKIDKMRRKPPAVKESAIYTTYTRNTSLPQYPYVTWIS